MASDGASGGGPNDEIQEAATKVDTAGSCQDQATVGNPSLSKEEARANAAAARLEQAMQEKDHGTELYKQKCYAEAIQAWKKALDIMPSGKDGNLSRLTLSLHLNLAQASLTTQDYDEAISQASSALVVDEENSKALYRRGLARDALGQVQAAARDMMRAARAEPRNAEIRKKYEEFKKKAQDLEAEEEKEDVPPVHDVSSLPRAFLDVAIGAAPAKRLVFALYSDSVPRTAENFRQLCTGEHQGTTSRGKPFSYKGCLLHRMIPGLMIQGGDFENANGTGGESIYGRRFQDESFADKHVRRGLLAMANDGPNTNGSNFFISFAAAEHLDRHHVIFGELIEGMEFLDELEALEVNEENRPLTPCTIVDCGQP